MKQMFTPEELAEMDAYDAEVDEEPLTMEELRESRERDKAALYDRKTKKEQKIAEGQRAYRAANKEKINAYMREYRRKRRLEG